MLEPVAFLSGKLLPTSQAAISIADAGFVLGVTATEQLRTFNGKLFRLPEHLRRLGRSLEILGIDAGMSLAEIGRTAEELAARNHALLSDGDDLGLGIFVTPGPYGTLAGLASPGPTVGIYTFPLPFQNWAATYERGQALRTTSIEQVSEKCWPRELKVRSRVHYFLADREAAAAEPGARAVMLDADGFITEGTTANLLLYTARYGLVTPPEGKVLPGISLSAIRDFATTEKIPFAERDIYPVDLANANEVFLCSTSSCILPMVRFNGSAVGDGFPGPMFHRLLTAWNRLAGLDLVAQAVKFSQRA